MSDGTFVEAIAETARMGTEAEVLARGEIHAFHLGSSVEIVDLTGDEHRDAPKRAAGTTVLRDVESFAELWRKHATAGVSEVYADRSALTVTAVLDAHGLDVPGWCRHRLVLKLQHSSAWRAWIERDGKLQEQEAFAEFLEDNRADIREPSAAEMLEIAQTIQGASKVEWQAGHRLVDGQRRIGYVETNSTKAGQKGDLAVPAQMIVGVPVFEGAKQAHALTARLRHRLNNGRLQLMYRLDRPEDVVTAAYDALVDELADACATVVLRGTPA